MMSDSVGHLRRDVQQGRRGKEGRGTRYPAARRLSITRHARQKLEQGASLAAFGGTLGVSTFTLSRWFQEAEPGSLRPVEVVVPVPTGRPSTGGLVVTTAGEVRVDGLDLPGLVVLLRILG